MALAERLLIDADVGDRPRLFPGLAPCDRAAHDAPGFIPTDARNLARAFHRAALQNQIDNQPLHQQRETTPRFGPRHAHLLHAMRRTLHPRNLRVQVRLKLTRVEMPPRACLGMVEARQHVAALRTRPSRRLVLQPQVDALVLGLQLDARHVPRRGDAENRLEQSGCPASAPSSKRSINRTPRIQPAAEQAPHPRAGPAQAASRITRIPVTHGIPEGPKNLVHKTRC